ncbi:MAG: DNA-3-methyladenine glycosylase [Bacteroidia bacterium]|nr:DNA-3-methyladenine glycosylase [Bacteroidia bacterium]
MAVLEEEFFKKDVLEVAPALIGKILCRRLENDKVEKFIITETEAYRGEEDLACHASKGRTKRTEVMYHEGGKIYVYLIYGMYWLLNIVTGDENEPQAVLIRGIEKYNGPGKLTKALQISGEFYGKKLKSENGLWIENNVLTSNIITSTRIGIDYAGEEWKNKPWRFILESKKLQKQ